MKQDGTLAHAVDQLASALRVMAVERADMLDAQRARAEDFKRDDFLWWALVVSAATWGNSRGEAGVMEPENRERLGYSRLAAMPAETRQAHLEQVLRDARVRWPQRKAEYLSDSVERIKALGGTVEAKAALEKQPGFAGKARFLAKFRGVSDKYSREILMGVYHPEARDRIALDTRVLRVAKALGVDLSATEYEAAEDFFRKVAQEAGLELWAADRLLYRFTDEVIARLGRPSGDDVVSNTAMLRRIEELEARVSELEDLLGHGKS